MTLSKFTDIISFSNKEISEEIIKTKNIIFNLRFKKATRQTFKSSELKNSKRKLAQLKTLLAMRVEEKQSNENIVVSQLVSN